MGEAASLAGFIRQHGTPVAAGVHDIDELVGILTPLTRPHRIIPRESRFGLDADVHALASANIAFTCLRYGADVDVVPSEVDPDTFLFPLTLSGRARLRSGRTDTLIESGDATLIAPYEEFRSQITHGHDQVIVAIGRNRVENAAASLCNLDASGPVELPVSPFEPPESLLILLEALAALTVESRDAPASPLLARLEDLVTESILLSMPRFQALLTQSRSPAPKRVAVAMDYMSEHLADPLTLVEIAEHAGITPRGLQLAFRKATGQTPMTWLRARRLERSHVLLRSGSDQLTVTEIARSCGFFHLGDFSRQFKARYGESPSSARL